MKILQELIDVKYNMISFVKIYYIKLIYIYKDGTKLESDMDLYFSELEGPNGAKDAYNHFIKNSVLPEGIVRIDSSIEEKTLQVRI